MEILNKLIFLAIILIALNYASGNFIADQLNKLDVSQYAGSAQCFIGSFMYAPTWNGIPMPAEDDIIFAVILTLLVLGILSIFDKKTSNKQKLAIFAAAWVLYKAIAYYLIATVPGCIDNFATVNQVISPLGPVFLVIAVVILWKILAKRRRK